MAAGKWLQIQGQQGKQGDPGRDEAGKKSQDKETGMPV